MTFDDAMVLTRTVSSHTAFEDEECKAYFDILMSLVPESLIVEIGLEYGRSSSIALQVAKERALRYEGIDPFPSEEVFQSWERMADSIYASYSLRCHRSDLIAEAWIGEPDEIASILIDGDHSYEQVKRDCEHFLPHVTHGGYAMFHDYGRGMGVESAVDEHFDGRTDWYYIGRIITLDIWRKL